MSFNNLHHGQSRNNTVTTGDRREHIQPETYCTRHGWVQAFQWHAHRNCDLKPTNGAEFEKPKAMAKAA